MMKRLTLVLFALLLGSQAFAYSNGNSTSGPLVDCQIDGQVKYIPIVICKHSGGQVL
ncbi:hypothetical protein [Vibrio sp. WXL103]|uniref:hypothetical protein n=1 Tax=unclassified Vibrio TaxID=2614977 RepID=UPI003EC4FE63